MSRQPNTSAPDPPPRAPTLRLFVAAQLPAAAQQAATAALAQLRAADPGGWRWVQPQALHLTLRFLGETPADQAPAAAAAMRRAAADSPPLEPALHGAGIFGGRRPRVLWLGLNGDLDGLQTLAAQLNLELEREGWPAEPRPLRPHITLARARRGASAAQLAAGRTLAAGLETRSEPFAVTAAQLIQSRLRPTGAEYSTLASAPLGGAVL